MVLRGLLVVAVSLAACTSSETVDFDARPSGGAGAPGATAGGGAGGTTAGPVGGSGGSSSQAGTGGHGVAGSGGGGSIGTGGVTGTGGAKVDAVAPDKGTGGGAGATGSDAWSTPDAPTFPLTFTAFISPMLINACGGCHFDGGTLAPKGGFGISYAKIMATVSGTTSGCPNLDATKKRVVPGKPDNSLIYIKVSVANLPGSCGGHMPYMGTNMSAENQASLKAWILAGAPQ
jgi:hypothetical protein